ncbi:MAG: type I glyceraldehyde-3-phosphate dehydrogenase [Patescibacteria group bacterium]|nr:type I glyceraldehyde-3-phosphate dehydrogenase [Patescibacteria group bacterium]MDD4443740.1 type I glyceraldehyde-3-phosphate dehydrogenase [Patescibacteria group bacterium]
MQKINVAINGFGRIGRCALKVIFDSFPNINIVAINDLAETEILAHLLRFDTVYGRYNKEVSDASGMIIVDKKKIPVFAIKDPSQLPWKKLKVDVVLECTGVFRDREALSLHLKAGAKKVILSAPAKGKGVKMIVLGVNEKKITKKDDMLSCASCTTNCLAPATEIIRQKFGIKKALMTTIHAYTANQNIVDGPNKDKRRARAGALNIVPTTTGAAIATTEVIPQLKNNFDGMAVRVPVPVGSLVDAVYILKKKTTATKVNDALTKAAAGKLKGIIAVTHEEIVSSDVIGNTNSTIIDATSTNVLGGDMLKLISWYDNEWGYSNRLVELALLSAKYIK